MSGIAVRSSLLAFAASVLSRAVSIRDSHAMSFWHRARPLIETNLCLILLIQRMRRYRPEITPAGPEASIKSEVLELGAKAL